MLVDAFNKYIELDNSNHVGGISYDYINDLNIYLKQMVQKFVLLDL